MLEAISNDPWLFAIVTGVIGSAAYALLVNLTKWGSRSWASVRRALTKSALAIRSVRITTTTRIAAAEARAVAEYKASLAEPNLTARPVPRHGSSYGWLIERLPQPRRWALLNLLGDDVVIESFKVSGAMEAIPPSVPVRLGSGERLEFEGRLITPRNAWGANVSIEWEDSHGDRHESFVPIVNETPF